MDERIRISYKLKLVGITLHDDEIRSIDKKTVRDINEKSTVDHYFKIKNKHHSAFEAPKHKRNASLIVHK